MCIGWTNKPSDIMHSFFKHWEQSNRDGFGYWCKTSTGREYLVKSPYNLAFKMHRGIKNFLLHCRQKTSGLKHNNGGGLENHPFLSEDEKLLLVHNGYISGYEQVRKKLTLMYNHEFTSQVDSEVLFHLFEQFYRKFGMTTEAIKLWIETMNKANIYGTINVICLDRTTLDWFAMSDGSLYALKPIASNDLFVASDSLPLGKIDVFKFPLKRGYAMIGNKNTILKIEEVGELGEHFGNYGYYGGGYYRKGITKTVGGWTVGQDYVGY